MLGAFVAILLHFAANSKQHYYLAGLIPLFPTFALFAHVMFASSGQIGHLQAAAKFGLLSLFPYGAYLALVWLLTARVSLLNAITLALFGWIVVAAGVTYIWNRF